MSKEIVQISDYDKNLILLIQQYKDSPFLQGIMKVFNKGANQLETACFEIRDLYWLDTAEGVQLDTIGTILGYSREGRSDADYRTFLKSNAGATFSGTPEEVISLLKASYGYPSPIEYFRDSVPAQYYIYDEDRLELSNDILETISPSGVLGLFAYPIAWGDTADDEPWLIDANGDEICAVAV